MELLTPLQRESVQNPLPGDKDGVVKEVLEDFAVLCLLLLSLLFCLCLGTSTTRSLFSPTALWLGGFSSFFCVNGPISVSSNWDFILKGRTEVTCFFPLHIINTATIHSLLLAIIHKRVVNHGKGFSSNK